MLQFFRVFEPKMLQMARVVTRQWSRWDVRQPVTRFTMNSFIIKRLMTDDSSWEKLKGILACSFVCSTFLLTHEFLFISIGFQRQDYLLQRAQQACTDIHAAIKFTNYYLKYADSLPSHTMTSLLNILLMHKNDKEACVVAEQLIQWYSLPHSPTWYLLTFYSGIFLISSMILRG